MKILLLARSTLFSQPGGDTSQINATAASLIKLGCKVEIATADRVPPVEGFDVVHFFNLFRPGDVLPHLKKIKKLAVTTIYVDYSEYDRQQRGKSWKLLHHLAGKFGMEYLKTTLRWLKGKEKFPGGQYLWRGQKSSISLVLKKAGQLICASHHEAAQLASDFPKFRKLDYSKIPLGSEHFATQKEQERNPEVVCLARIEGLKNQLNLIRAVRGDYPLKLYGQAAANQGSYLKQCQQEAGENVKFMGHRGAEELSQVLAEIKVHALPSYFETTGLATLEALKAGCQAVVADRGPMREIFGNHVFYGDPASPISIRKAIDDALAGSNDHRGWVEENFSWDKAALQILDIYRSL